jgi:hypothetical protein
MRTSENGLWFGLFLNVVPKTLARPNEPTLKDAPIWAPIRKDLLSYRKGFRPVALRRQRLGAENCPQPISEQV